MDLKVIKIAAKELGLTEHFTNKVQSSMWVFIREMFEKGDKRGVLLHGFGKFVVKPEYRDDEAKAKLIEINENGLRRRRLAKQLNQNRESRAHCQTEAANMPTVPEQLIDTQT